MTIAPGADSSGRKAGAVPNGARCKSAAGATPLISHAAPYFFARQKSPLAAPRNKGAAQ